MDGDLAQAAWQPRGRADMVRAVRQNLPRITAEAADRDADGAFPAEGLARLREAGVLAAPLPPALGGLGMGTTEAAATETAELLALIGSASLPLGRVYEGHVNAIRLICRLGTHDQARRAADDARAGHLFGVWNTDPADAPLAIEAGVLRGAKILASGAGIVTRALVTAQPRDAGGPRPLLLVPLPPGTRADLSGWTAQGMRASATGRLDFDGIAMADAQIIGQPGDYLRQPDFSAGAWRVLAVQQGGLRSVLNELRAMLLARGRAADPHQLGRLGATLIAAETAHLFVQRAAALAEADHRDTNATVAYVGLARIAVETACLQAMQLAQRSVGLAAFMRPAPIERICRDLATYLRQPVPDAVLNDAAAHFLHHLLPR